MRKPFHQAGPGRPKGVPNKNTLLLKDALIQAATEAGGKEGLVGYLKTQAIKNPGFFMPQLGKVLPLQITGADGGPVMIVTGVQRIADEVNDRMSDSVLEERRKNAVRIRDEANAALALELKANDADD